MSFEVKKALVEKYTEEWWGHFSLYNIHTGNFLAEIDKSVDDLWDDEDAVPHPWSTEHIGAVVKNMRERVKVELVQSYVYVVPMSVLSVPIFEEAICIYEFFDTV